MMQTMNRKIGLVQATAINMIDMVGIGPFIVMPIVISRFGNGTFIWAWIFGAVAALIDGMIWSELGAKFPLAGGTYNFHKLAYGKQGRMMSFLFVWQTSIQAPLVVASGAIGFAQYFSYLVPLTFWTQRLVSGSLIILVFLLLYRRIETIGKISVALGVVVIATILWIIIAGFTHRQHGVEIFPAQGIDFSMIAVMSAVGYGSLKTVYAYLGYYNVCHLGGEIRSPEKNIPRSIFISIFGIAALYLLMNFSVGGVVNYSLVTENDQYLVSSFMQQVSGRNAGILVTVLILVIAMSSLFAVVLGYSRVPYAAAADGNFFPVFAKLHPEKNFPYVSLIVLCSAGFLFSMFMKLSDVITSILAMRIVIQFIGQAIGVVLIRKRNGTESLPFRMWLYPVPVILSIITWLFLLYSTGWYALFGTLIAAGGWLVYRFSNKHQREITSAPRN